MRLTPTQVAGFRVHGGGREKRMLSWQPDRDYRIPDFWAVACSYKGHSDQTLSRVKTGGRRSLLQNAILQGQQAKVSWPGCNGSLNRGQGIRLAADHSSCIVSWSATSRVTSAQVTGTPLHIQAALAQAKGRRPSLRGYLLGITLEPRLGMDAVWSTI